MELVATEIKGVYILKPKVFGDNRGWFMETWSKSEMEKHGLFYDFVQDNQSFSAKKGTLRGIHLQNGDMSQAKLVRCLRGRVMDFAVDLRKGSPTYKKWVAAELSEENKYQFLIPRGFGHGFLSLTDNVEFAYKVDNDYAPKTEVSIRWNDPEIGIDWGIKNPVMSEKDLNAPLLKDCDIKFIYNDEE